MFIKEIQILNRLTGNTGKHLNPDVVVQDMQGQSET